MRPKKYHRITEIVGAIYCEQKVVFDRLHGDARPISVKAKATTGTFEHIRFEIEGKTQRAVDKRCFIASHVYGMDAPQTNSLRRWRDRALAPTRAGRMAIACYYMLSPTLLVVLRRSALLTRLVRRGLDVILRVVGGAL
jgi:hypothetical protein